MEFTRYKALRASKLVILVPPAYSSQECAFCTFTSPESPRVFCVDNRPHQAAFVCQQCGHTDHAGHNAACVIAKRGIQKLLSGDPLTKMHKPTRIFPHKNREDFRKLDRMMTPSRAPESVVGTLRVSGKYFREDWCLMEQYTRYIGFDVSAEPIVIAEALPGRERARDLGTIPYRLDSVSQWIRRQPDAASLLICYEAGPTGFGLARPLHRLGGACEVIAPGLIPHQVDVSLFPLQWKIYFHRPPKFYAGE